VAVETLATRSSRGGRVGRSHAPVRNHESLRGDHPAACRAPGRGDLSRDGLAFLVGYMAAKNIGLAIEAFGALMGFELPLKDV
jgi:hypothetical protein